jgi:hypothetical protein
MVSARRSPTVAPTIAWKAGEANRSITVKAVTRTVNVTALWTRGYSG